ncbi:MAG: SRPBCC domain-containing protein [Bacteroidota bacterium]
MEDLTVTSVRMFNYPQMDIFDAWTNPRKLAKWWGPNGFTNIFDEHDPTPGGRWRFTMHGPDGTNYKNEVDYVDVTPECIVLDHVNWPLFRLTATFEPVGANQTKLTFKQAFQSAEDFEKVKAIVVPANEENLDRLEAVLLSEKHSS